MKNELSELEGSHIAYFIFFWQGIGNLLPWNAFITAAGYYYDRFCDTDYSDNFENWFSIGFNILQTVGLLLAVKYQHLYNVKLRVILPLFLFFIIFTLTAVIVVLKDMDGSLVFYLTMICIVLSGSCGAWLSGGIFGLAGQFPPIYTQAVMGGQGLAGLLAALAYIVSVASGKDTTDCDDDDLIDDDDSCDKYEIDYSALSYFIFTAFVLLSCILSFIYLLKLPITKHYTGRASFSQKQDTLNEPLLHLEMDFDESDDEDEERNNNIINNNTITNNTIVINPIAADVEARQRSNSRVLAKSAIEHEHTDDILDTILPRASLSFAASPNTSDGFTLNSLISLLKIIKYPAFGVLLIFWVTIGIFPAMTSKIQSMKQCDNDQRFYNDLFIPFSFVIFNLFDLIGRMLAGWKQIFSQSGVFWAALTRIIFFPLFLLCNVDGTQLDVVFNNDAWPILFMMLFAITNGYIASLCMMYGPTMVNLGQAETAGAMMILFLTLGLFSGAGFSFISLDIGTGHF